MSKIEWTEVTWNPVTGCSHASPGCDHCYAERMATRLAGRAGYPADKPFTVTLHPDRLEQPGRWRKPKTVFVCSMADLFHPDVPDAFLETVWHTMRLAPRHTFQVLTKRPTRAASWARRFNQQLVIDDAGSELQPLANIWLGTSIEGDRWVWRAERLRGAPAAIRFLSLEPLLGPLPSLDLAGIDWVIVGGESGPGARPMEIAWAEDIVGRCLAAAVPVFVKQLGSAHGKDHHDIERFPVSLRYRQMPTPRVAGLEVVGRG